MTIALPAVAAARPKDACRKNVWCESEPVEVVENRRFVLRFAALAVVVFDAEQDLRARSPAHIPHAMGIQDVSEVQVPRRSRARSA
jgi:hypothetical protein